MAPWTIAMCRAESGGPCPRPGGVFVAGWLVTARALAFHRSTMSVGSAAATEAVGSSPATAIRASAVTLASHRLAGDLCLDRTVASLHHGGRAQGSLWPLSFGPSM